MHIMIIHLSWITIITHLRLIFCYLPSDLASKDESMVFENQNII